MDLVAGALARADRDSPFLRGALARNPSIVSQLTAGTIQAALNKQIFFDDGDPRRDLRLARDRLALVLAIGDLAGLLPLERVVAELSAFADQALDTAIHASVVGSNSAGFAAIALGKHGSRELNYSSDIDPILLYDPAIVSRRPKDDPAEAAVRIARGVVDLLQTRDANGYVFRVDLRLRPASEATPMAIPVEAAISHYESSALGWERAAFIRARAAAGDVALGQGFIDAIRPFVWRRSLDFGAAGELRALSRAIRGHHAKGQAFGPGYDLKRGRGGIREVEFYVQIHQLIHGGRDPSLRAGATLDAIAALGRAGWIAPGIAATLAAAYRLFRTIEHRLQMVDDRQTHSLPVDPAALDGVARLHGLDNGGDLLALLEPHVAAVGTLYDALDGEAKPALPRGDRLRDSLIAARLDPDPAIRRIEEWRSGKLRAVRSAAAFEALEAVLPRLIAAFGDAPDPDAALRAFDALLSGLPTALNLFRLLDAQPALLGALLTILSHAPTLAEALGRRASLLDRLIDATAFDSIGDVPTLAAEMNQGRDIEAILDRVRQIVGEHRFALGAQIVDGAADPLDAACGYGRLAEAAVQTVAAAVTADFESAHGRVPGGDLVVLALGRLGGGALTHASDLDLIYLFTGDFANESDGRRPLGATHYFNRLAARISAGLSVPTSAGALYEIDTRLRPSGTQGPLAVSFDSFEKYQRESAWTWEHMALTRARPIHGRADACKTLETLIADVLKQPRDRAALARDVVAMRDEMAAHKPPLGDLDVKLSDGGLVDLEFTVHFHQLASGVGIAPGLSPAIEALAAAGLIPAALGDAHDLMMRLMVALRLVAPTLAAPPPATRAVVARACGFDDWDSLLARLHAARQDVRDAWARIRTEAA